MSNIKLVSQSTDIPDGPYTILDARGWTAEEINEYTMRRYDTLFAVITSTKPICGEFAYRPSNINIESICKSVSTRTHVNNGIAYDIYKLWHYSRDLPVYKISVDWIYDHVFGSNSSVWGARLTNYHKNMIDAADLKYPILLYKKTYDNIDGAHRIAKAKKIGRKYISYKLVPSKILNKCKIKDWVNIQEYQRRFICPCKKIKNISK